MCVVTQCGCDRGAGEFLLALSGSMVWWLLRQLARAIRLLLIGLLAALLWATPRVWRAALRVVDAVERVGVRWRDRRLAVVVDERPVTIAITDRPADAVRWSDLTRSESR